MLESMKRKVILNYFLCDNNLFYFSYIMIYVQVKQSQKEVKNKGKELLEVTFIYNFQRSNLFDQFTIVKFTCSFFPMSKSFDSFSFRQSVGKNDAECLFQDEYQICFLQCFQIFLINSQNFFRHIDKMGWVRVLGKKVLKLKTKYNFFLACCCSNLPHRLAFFRSPPNSSLSTGATPMAPPIFSTESTHVYTSKNTFLQQRLLSKDTIPTPLPQRIRISRNIFLLPHPRYHPLQKKYTYTTKKVLSTATPFVLCQFIRLYLASVHTGLWCRYNYKASVYFKHWRRQPLEVGGRFTV